MYTYFDDSDYFNYLLQQMFNSWSYLFVIVYNDITVELRWIILLQCPYDFIPEVYINNRVFMDEWNRINSNKIVIVNGNEKYYINHKSYNGEYLATEISNYHTIIGDDKMEVGHRFTIRYNTNGQIIYYSRYFNGKLNGLQESWYNEGQTSGSQLKSRNYYVNNVQHGLSEQWYSNGNLEFRENYDNGKPHGVWEEWYVDGTLKSHGTYVNGKIQGIQKQWYDNGQLQHQKLYLDGYLNGTFEAWYGNGQPSYHGHYSNGKQDGLWIHWSENGDIISQTYR